jgi:hypothetical protein
MLAFVGAVYRLYLYSFTSHGEGVEKMAGCTARPREYAASLGHLLPLVGLVLKGDLFIV